MGSKGWPLGQVGTLVSGCDWARKEAAASVAAFWNGRRSSLWIKTGCSNPDSFMIVWFPITITIQGMSPTRSGCKWHELQNVWYVTCMLHLAIPC